MVEQGMQGLLGWVPTPIGMALRAVLYRLMLRADGWVGIERRVRLRFANLIRLGDGCYLDEGVYIHACPRGVEIGPRTLVMHGAVLKFGSAMGLSLALSTCVGWNLALWWNGRRKAARA